MADFVPKKENDLVGWLTNVKQQITTHGVATLGLLAPKVTLLIGLCEALIAAITDVDSKKAALAAAVTAKDDLKLLNLGLLRGELNVLKVNTAMTDALKAQFRIVGSTGTFDAEAYKPQLIVEAFSGYVRAKFTKKGVDGVKIYSRLKGQTVWKLLSYDTNSPYDDHTPLATPGVAEVREYQAFGVLNDEQIGQPSDIVSVTFGG